MALAANDLVLCAATLAETPLLERLDAAQRAGYRGLSLFLDDLEKARATGLSDRDIKRAIADRGLEVAELDPVLSWAPGARPGPGFARWQEDDFFAAAESIGARSLNAAYFAPPAPHDEIVEAFAALCDRAADVGLLVHLEFMPFAPIANLESALHILDDAKRDNAGLMLDVWHFFRGGGRPEALEAVATRVIATQLDDAPAEAEENLIEETLHRRLLPGEGDADVAGILRTLARGGCQAPIGVEVFSDDFAGLSSSEVAQRCADAARRCLNAVAD